jgi:ABC-2 type transport system ATP-binding protein
VTSAISTRGLGKRYGSTWALRDCTLEIPAGSVTALVGPNGAGKTTLLQLAVGLSRPTAGELQVLGEEPGGDPGSLLPRIGFVAQDHPLHRGFTVAETLELGRRLNPRWDAELAETRLERLGLPARHRVGKLSGGQQAQVALTLALAKRPELLVLDEPVASLDPVARREFMNTVMEAVTDAEISVVLSSHILADLERVCDHLVILSHARTVLAAPIDEIVASHVLLTGPRSEAAAVARHHTVVRERHTERQTSLLVHSASRVFDAVWEVHEIDLEEIVLAYLGYGGAAPAYDRLLDEAVAP